MRLIQLSELSELIQLSELRVCGRPGGSIWLPGALLVVLVRSMGVHWAILLAIWDRI